MKRGILLVLLLSLLVVAFPAAAQDAVSTPAACTDAERAQVVDLVNKGTASFGQAGQNNAGDQSIEALTAKMIDYGNAVIDFNSNYYSNFPACMDGILMQETVGVTIITNMTLLIAWNTLDKYEKAAEAPNTDLVTAIEAAIASGTTDMQSAGQSFSTVFAQLAQGPVMTEWFPACTAEQLSSEAIVKLDDFEQTYSNMAPDLQAYLDDGTLDDSTYLAALQLWTDPNTDIKSFSACADVFPRIINDLHIFGDTLITLTYARTQGYVDNQADADTAAKYDETVTTFNSVLQYYVNLAMGTPEATQAAS